MPFYLYSIIKTLSLLFITTLISNTSPEVTTFPKDYKFRNFRHIPLSSFKNDKKDQPKVTFHKNVIKQMKEQNFQYTNLPIYYEYTIDRDRVENYTANLKGREHKQQDLPADVFGNKRRTVEFLSSLFNGPLYNFDVRRSTLSDNLNFEIFGLFSRDFIPEHSVIGNYVGYIGFGADADYESFTYSDRHYEYIYNGERDYIDSARQGNFMRYVNHQDAPSVEATPVYVPKYSLYRSGKITKELYDKLPTYVETMVFQTIRKIYPGDELFVDYGENYWADKSYNKVRQLSSESMSRHMDEMVGEINEIKEENARLSEMVVEIRSLLKDYFALQGRDFFGDGDLGL